MRNPNRITYPQLLLILLLFVIVCLVIPTLESPRAPQRIDLGSAVQR